MTDSEKVAKVVWLLNDIVAKDYTELELRIWEVVNDMKPTAKMRELATRNTKILVDNS